VKFAKNKVSMFLLVGCALLGSGSSALAWPGAMLGPKTTIAVRELGAEKQRLGDTRKSIVLQEGSFRNRHWQAIAFRPRHAEGGGAVVCLEIVVRRRLAGQVEALQSGGAECGRISDQDPKPVLTQFNIAGASLLAVAAPRIVEDISFSVNPGPPFTKQLHDLNVRQKEKIGLGILRYSAFRIQPLVCVEQLVGASEDGTQLFETPAREC
jgi:hypothetical protein